MNHTLNKLIKLSQKKLEIDKQNTWSDGSQTYVEAIKNEIKEAEDEIDNGNKILLEDELADILWDYLNILQNLEDENKIDVNSVFERAEQKYSERIEAIENDVSWSEIKAKQKEELQNKQNPNNR